MARSVALIAQQQSTLPILFAMAGHDEGIVAFGTDVASVLALLIETYRMTISP
jgi:hypothetical protein